MATYAIGDVHGCFASLQALLAHCRFDRRQDHLWFVGDLVNRGPNSLGVLRLVAELGDRARVALGNHDLHLLGRAWGLAARRPKDRLEEVLDAPDAPELLAWLKTRSLLVRDGSLVMVHAGLLPAWSLTEAEKLAREVEGVLRGEDAPRLLVGVRVPPYPTWSKDLPALERQRLALTAFVHLRGVTDQDLPFERFAGRPTEAPPGCFPWFSRPHRREEGLTVLFGHWAALGFYRAPGLVGLDSGCAWGGRLTAMRLEDGALFQVENVEGTAPR